MINSITCVRRMANVECTTEHGAPVYDDYAEEKAYDQ